MHALALRLRRLSVCSSLFLSLLFLSVWVPALAAAESALRLPMPETLGVFPAATYDDTGEQVGLAVMAVESLPDGLIRFVVQSGVRSGARNVAIAWLEPTDDGGVRPVRQTSQAFDQRGRSLGLLEIDHRAATARCVGGEHPGGAGDVVPLAPRDRIGNVPLNLLFQPLLDGQQERVEFQFFICRGGGRVIDFAARVAGGVPGAPGIVEIQYGPDLGGMFSWVSRAVLPRLSFWLDPLSPNHYVAHRMPLYTRGPEVLVVRKPLTPRALAHVP
ncbi:MAG: hypothetical protein MJE66_06935 [Proteobacteria bacterium]|nr:hypothetical protein [Pseudomonadota bacterium]